MKLKSIKQCEEPESTNARIGKECDCPADSEKAGTERVKEVDFERADALR